MLNYGIDEFLGIFLFGIPAMIALTLFLQRGLWLLIRDFVEDNSRKNFFHHHFHYKAR